MRDWRGRRGAVGRGVQHQGVLGTEWLEAIGIPETSRRLIDPPTGPPLNGITPKPGTSESTEPESAAAVAETFQVYVEGKVLAEVTVVESDEGTFYVGEVAHC
jgi:hypothetical protein